MLKNACRSTVEEGNYQQHCVDTVQFQEIFYLNESNLTGFDFARVIQYTN